MRPVNEVVIHCTATRPDFMEGRSTSAKVAEIRRWHTSPPLNWSDIGYHFLIDRDGAIAEGRPIERVGAHVSGRNHGTIGVSLFGGHGSSERDHFAEHFTPEQEQSLVVLINQLRAEYGDLAVTGHNQFAAKACPGFNAPEWWAQARKASPPSSSKPTSAQDKLARIAGLNNQIAAIIEED